MSNYPPKGKEKTILKKIEELIGTLNEQGKKIRGRKYFGDLHHAIKGVRVNGHERVVGLLDVYKTFGQDDDELQDEVRKLDAYAELFAETRLEIESLVGDNFGECPICHGKKGENKRNTNDICKKFVWTDCKRCKGRGIISY